MEREELMTDETPKRGGGLGFWFALLAMLGICLFAVYRSPLFRLERVQIAGNARLSQADILEIAGLAPGMLRWEAPAERVRERLEAEPWIRSASVAWRGSRLVIEVAERMPLALLPYHGSYYLVLDEEGTILGQRQLDEGSPLPVISGLTVTSALRGQKLQHRGLQDGLAVLAWTAEPLRRQVSEVQIREDGYIRLYMAGGATVHWGVLPAPGPKRDDFIQKQVKRFGGLWDRLDRSKLTGCIIDLRVADTVTTLGCE